MNLSTKKYLSVVSVAGVLGLLVAACATTSPAQVAVKAPDPDISTPIADSHPAAATSQDGTDSLVFVHSDMKRAPSSATPVPEALMPENMIAHPRASN